MPIRSSAAGEDVAKPDVAGIGLLSTTSTMTETAGFSGHGDSFLLGSNTTQDAHFNLTNSEAHHLYLGSDLERQREPTSPSTRLTTDELKIIFEISNRGDW